MNIIEKLYHNQHIREKSSPIIDEKVFGHLYEETYPSLFRYIYGLTGGPELEVEDLTIDTYLRAWKNRQSYNGEIQAAIGWLIRIAHNLVIDRYRQEKINKDYPTDHLEEELQSDNTISPEESFILGEDQQILLNLLQQITSEQREILILRYLLGWKVNQIASHLEVPENTISAIIRRSLQRLQQNWPEDRSRK